MRFTILADATPVVMVAAISACVALPLLYLPIADPYQPIRLLVAAAAAGLLVIVGTTPENGIPRVVTLLTGGFFACVLASALNGGMASGIFGVPGRLEGLLLLAVMLLSGLAGTRVGTSRFIFLVRAIAVLGLGMGVVAIVQANTGAEPVLLMGNRVIAGAWFAIATVVTSSAALVVRTRDRWLLFGSALVSAVALGMAGSRGAWVGAVLGFAVHAFALRGRARKSLLIIVVVLACVLIGALVGGVDSSAKLDPSALATGSAQSRAEIWRGAVAMVGAHPLLGVGPGRFIYTFPRFQSSAHAAIEAPDTRADQAHSWPLQLASEIGLPGAVLAAALVVLVFWCGMSRARAKDGVALIALAGATAYLGQGLFGVPSAEVDVLGMLLAGVVLARGRDVFATGETRRHARWLSRAVAGVATIVVVAACGLYVRADASYAVFLDEFSAGSMVAAGLAAERAVRMNPTVDIYRVAQSDAALYMTGGRERDDALDRAEESLRGGLALEPDSFDLAYALARVMKALKAPVGSVATQYARAVALYPNGIAVRQDAIMALENAGRIREADRMRAGLSQMVGRSSGEAR